MQKRVSWILLVLLALLAGIYLLFIHPLDANSLTSKEIDFSVKDTSTISKVILTRVNEGKDVERLTLIRQKDQSWKLNDRYPAFQPRVSTLLETIHLIHVREVLAEAGIEAGKELMDYRHTRVEVYDKDKLIKSYKVGTEGKGGRGTLMMLKGATNPYMVEIPGLQGYVNSRYSMELGIWRENLLFQANESGIRSIDISYRETPQQSFHLGRQKEGDSWKLLDQEVALDSLALQTYLAHFNGKVYAETFATNRYPGKLQVLKGNVPDVSLDLAYFSGESRKIKLYERPENPNNYFGWVNESEELLTIQHFVIDKYLIDRDYLIHIDS